MGGPGKLGWVGGQAVCLPPVPASTWPINTLYYLDANWGLSIQTSAEALETIAMLSQEVKDIRLMPCCTSRQDVCSHVLPPMPLRGCCCRGPLRLA